ncbi:MAG: RcnB family protein [Sphingosinicella sp.]|nr:RcnB family protein [Sphingosinicella sp.]
MAAFAQESEVSEARAERRQTRIEQRTERRQERVEARTEQHQERTERPQREESVPGIEGRAQTFPGHEARARRVITEARQERREDRTERREDRREDRVDRRQDRREDRVERRDDRRDVRLDRRGDRREDRADRREHRRDWNRGWRNDRRYDWQSHRYSNRNAFRLGRYYSPYRNHGYSRFSIGLRLGSGFYSDRYWINDPWQYRLPPAYAGTRWVRYYDDVLLVDMYTGEVIDVIYGFFW